MKLTTFILSIAMTASTLFAAAIVPVPVIMEPRSGTFTLGPKTRIVADVPSLPTAQYLANLTGYQVARDGDTGDGDFRVSLSLKKGANGIVSVALKEQK